MDGDIEGRIKGLEREVDALRARVAGLCAVLEDLVGRVERFRHPVETVLKQRGFPVLSSGLDRRFLPFPGSSARHGNELYRLMRRYSFRLFLRDLIHFPEHHDIAPLTRYCSPGTARMYLARLESMGYVAVGPGPSYRFLPKGIVSFGPTLEWYVSEVFQRELLAPALFNLRLENTRSGGDYDVMALLSGELVYVEVKSSPPRGVELPAVRAFLNRLGDLQPSMAIFLVDTELRMLDKLVPLFDESLRGLLGGEATWSIQRVAGEIFQIGHTVFIMNSRKGIYSNLRACIRHGFQHRDNARMVVGSVEDGGAGGVRSRELGKESGP
ncbi:MAG: hypothetical protein MUF52_07665 [Syntrophobacteraceae bacterium]|nr:hypothetical protein [Syntrophobacteraceae bacterium]